MLEFRKLAEVEQATELMEGEEVLISDGEKVKKIAPKKIGEHVPENLKKAAVDGDGFGYTDEDEIHQIDSKYIKKEELVPEEIEKAIETHGMGWTDEEEIEGFEIGIEIFEEEQKEIILDPNLGYNFYKFSNKTLSEIQFLHSIYTYTNEGTRTTEVKSDLQISLGDKFYLTVEEFMADEPHFARIIKVAQPDQLDHPEVLSVETDLAGYSGLYVMQFEDFRIKREASTEEVIHQIDKKYIPQGSEVTNAIKTGGVGWTDENVRTIIFSSNDIEWTQGGDFDTTFIELPEHIVPDDEYIVSWEGVEYRLIADSYDLGHGSLGRNGDTPFFIYPSYNGGLEYEIYNYAWDGAQHITITHVQPHIIHQIDEKYIPNSVEYDLIINTTIDPEGGYFDWEYPYVDAVAALKTLLKNDDNIRAPKVLVRFFNFDGRIWNVEAVCVGMASWNENITIRVANPLATEPSYERSWIYITVATDDDYIDSSPNHC